MTHEAMADLTVARVDDLIDSLVACDRSERAPPLAVAEAVTALLGSREGQKALETALDKLPADLVPGPYIAYVGVAVLSKAGQFERAAALLKRARARRNKARITRLWSIIDQNSYDAKSEAVEGSSRVGGHARFLELGRVEEHIAASEAKFASARTLMGKLSALRTMTAQALRPLSDYGPAYRAARSAFASLVGSLDWRSAPLERLAGGRLPEPLATFAALFGLIWCRGLISALYVSSKLGLTDQVEKLSRRLYALADHPVGALARWPIAAILVETDYARWLEPTRRLARARPRQPWHSLEVRFCFEWAARCAEFALADQVYARLSDTRKYASGVGYSVILQRTGRFRQARELLTAAHARRLADGRNLNGPAHWKAVTRIAQIAFAERAAEVIGRTAQPRAPAGVLFVLSRTVNLATLLPLVVLEDLRRRNWAIIPLVDGVLPLDPTGLPEIDRFLGCIGANGHLKPDFQPDRSVEVDYDAGAGRLRVDGLALDHVLWEEAAIKQRRYRVNFACPVLGKSLGRLVTWSRSTVMAIDAARTAMRNLGLPAGVLVTFQARLPDAVVHGWCARNGDPQRFFCVQGANGYQNYFANFSQPVSSRMAVRNMTAAGRLRSPSFPTTGEFAAYFEAVRGRADEILARVQDITRMRRSNRVGGDLPRGAVSVRDEVRDWRARGGNVACIFGKVVCDSGVPVDGGPAHRSMSDWLNHTVSAVRGSRTLLLIKPHPHELRNEIGAYLAEYFVDLIDGERPDNVRILGHDWFDMADMKDLIDLGLVYNGTSAIELGLLDIPTVLCSDFAPVDYPIGQAIPTDRLHYERLVRFEETPELAPDVPQRAAAWLHYMSQESRIQPYRYHARPITNRSISPPWWFEDDLAAYLANGDPAVARLADEITGI